MTPRWWRIPAALLTTITVATACTSSTSQTASTTDTPVETATPATATRTTSDIPRGGGVTPPIAPANSPTLTPAAAEPSPTATPQPPPTPAPVLTSVAPPSSAPQPRKLRETPAPAIQAKTAIVIDADSGAVLYDKDAHTPLPPASTTKILTLLLALERGNLDDEVTVELDNRTYWGSAMGLVNGDRFTLRDLLYGLILPSGNDAAYAIAKHIAGSEPAFAELMNERMRALGLRENLFRNASGLGRAETGNIVSAFDLAQLSRVAMMNPEFARIVNTRTWVARGSRTIGMSNGNELLYRFAGADGVKIGWGGASAGQTVVGTAVRNGHRLIVALLNTPDRPGEAGALLNWGFTTFAWEDR